jgi:hypothetical protein
LRRAEQQPGQITLPWQHQSSDRSTAMQRTTAKRYCETCGNSRILFHKGRIPNMDLPTLHLQDSHRIQMVHQAAVYIRTLEHRHALPDPEPIRNPMIHRYTYMALPGTRQILDAQLSSDRHQRPLCTQPFTSLSCRSSESPSFCAVEEKRMYE